MTIKLARLLCPITLALWVFTQPSFAQGTKIDKETNQKVQALYETLYAGLCRSLMEGNTPHQPTIHEFTFNYKGEEYPPRPYRLYEYLCFEGPYNQSNVYFGANDYQEITHLTFAVPTFDVTYKNTNPDSAVKNISLTGFTTIDQVVNAEFDETTKIVNSFAKWRGPADAFTSGVWNFIGGKFVLQSFEVDASYDGERIPIIIYGDEPPRLIKVGEDQ